MKVGGRTVLYAPRLRAAYTFLCLIASRAQNTSSESDSGSSSGSDSDDSGSSSD